MLIVAARFIKKPILWVVVLLAAFGFIIWNGEETRKRSERELAEKEIKDKTTFEKFADLLIEQYEISRLHGNTDFMVDLLNHLNSKMAELGIGTNN